MEAVKVLLGIGETLAGRILTFNGLDLTFNEIRLEKNRKCPLCGENPEIRELVEYEMNYCASKVKGATSS
jgi:adenylyltransferase/sulfurtransferase